MGPEAEGVIVALDPGTESDHSTLSVKQREDPDLVDIILYLKGARTYCIINKWHQATAKECCDSIKPLDR